MPSAVSWVESLSPWPPEFGLERMHALLADLGDPQRAFPAIHVVGTNGKSTAARTIESLLLADGRSVGTYLSPHVRRWDERIRVGGEEADFATAVARIRDAAERHGATQFEVATAAALLEFAEGDVDVAVVEAGLGGRLDATNVLAAPVVLLTNVGLEHTDVLGETREEIAREKLAVAVAGATVVLPDREFAPLVPASHVVVGGAREAAEAFAGHPLPPLDAIELPGRLEYRNPDEIWDGAHNADGVAWLVQHLPSAAYTIVSSILRDKDVETMLERLAQVGHRLVATESSNDRALPADELAARARRYFADVSALRDPGEAVAFARRRPPVLVTGSLYLLADLSRLEEQRVK
jgi:dihydrofolate synthase/folylpolyglutamate synthase